MEEIEEKFRKEIEVILDCERWKGYLDGMVEGALNVLYAMDLSKEERIKLLSKTVGLCDSTASSFLEHREIEERIWKNTELSIAEKNALISLMSNKAMMDETVMNHPKQTLKFISSFGGEKFIEECLPTVDNWVEKGEEVSMRRVRDWIIKKYDLF